jgi:hypothetical protein
MSIANHRDALGAQVCGLLAVHEPGPGVQQVMRFAARRRGAHEQFEVGQGELGRIEGLRVAIVAAPDDDVVIRAAVQQREHLREIGGKGAVAPGVERIAVTADKADAAFDLSPQRRQQRRQRQPGRGRDVEDQLGQPARGGDDGDPPSCWRHGALGRGEHLGKCPEVRDFDRAMSAKQFGGDAGIAGIAAGMRGDRMPRAFAVANFQDNDRFARRGRPVERRGEPLGLSQRLDKAADHAGMRFIDEIFEIIRGDQNGLTAGRDNMAETEASEIGQQAHAESAALRDDADIAGQTVRVAQLLQVGRRAIMRAQHAHAVRPAKRNARLAADAFDLVLQPAPVIAAFGKTAVIDDGNSHPALGRGNERVEDPLVADAKRGDIGRPRQIGKARIALPARHCRVIGVDRIDRAVEAHAVERGDQPSADRRLFGSTDDGNRFWLEQRVEPHRHASSSLLVSAATKEGAQ